MLADEPQKLNTIVGLPDKFTAMLFFFGDQEANKLPGMARRW